MITFACLSGAIHSFLGVAGLFLTLFFSVAFGYFSVLHSFEPGQPCLKGRPSTQRRDKTDFHSRVGIECLFVSSLIYLTTFTLTRGCRRSWWSDLVVCGTTWFLCRRVNVDRQQLCFLASAWYESFSPGINLSISARASCSGIVAWSYRRCKL